MRVSGAIVILLSAVLLATCTAGQCPPPGPAVTPQFATLSVPDTAGSWSTATAAGSVFAVLPVRGRAVRVYFYAPLGGSYRVTLREPDGTETALGENHHTPAPADAGFFEILDVNPNTNSPTWTMYVRAPTAMNSPVNYDILVVNLGGGAKVNESAPMVVDLDPRPRFTVSIRVTGDGHVTSNPGGVACGTSPQGRPLAPCDFDFAGSVSLSLNPNSNPGARFVGWSGNCTGRQVCSLTLNGEPVSAVAQFEQDSGTTSLMPCPTAPMLPGLRWIDLPNCATGQIGDHPGINLACDAQGYFCCEPETGASSPRCGANKRESQPDCRHHAPRGLLRQPGGCYESASFP
jgi:hypothetical protein